MPLNARSKPRLPDGLGLQSRLTIAFGLTLTLALGFCCVALSLMHSQRSEFILAERVRELGDTAALAAGTLLDEHHEAELQRLAARLRADRDVVFVAFFRPDGSTLSAHSDIPDNDQSLRHQAAAEEHSRVTRRRLPGVGSEVVDIIVPIIQEAPDGPRETLLGYARVAISSQREMVYLRQTLTIVLGIGCIFMVATLPLSWWLMRKMLTPIRDVALAARRIAEGSMDVRVPVGDGSEAGMLAHAFNDMVSVVAHQRLDLEDVNSRLASANQQLEGRIMHRTAQLETANRRLHTEIAEKEDFLRAISHDLNAPLRNIDGLVAMLLTKHADTLNDEVVLRLERVRVNVRHETDLIGELLELSRIKTRRDAFQEVDPERMIWELRGVFESDLREKNIELRLETSLPRLWAEPARIRQVLQNLIDNAIKYMGDSIERQIRIGCRLRNDEAEFYITDTGIGIDEDDAQRIFHVFRRGRAAGAVAGKGVGLASVKSIIETYNGTISATGSVGVGTTFTFTINGQYVPAIGGKVGQQPAGIDDPEEFTELPSRKEAA